MSGFRNLPWKAVQITKRTDKFGGRDWFVMDATNAIVAEVFEVVGEGPNDTLDVRDAEFLANMIADMANKTGELQ